MDRGPEVISTFLAVLKAGGAYLPLDTSYPAERINYMISDSRSSLVLSSGMNRALLKDLSVRIEYLDEEQHLIEKEDPSRLPSFNIGEDLAYIIYTSGSTGNPKGVAIPHHGVTRLVCSPDYIDLGFEDRIIQASNMSFDAATFEIWGALLNGGRLEIIPQDTLLDPIKFAKWVSAREVQSTFLTAALFNQIAMKVPAAFAPMRDVLTGGEALSPGWVRKVFEAGVPLRLLNVYGPTEVHDVCSYA